MDTRHNRPRRGSAPRLVDKVVLAARIVGWYAVVQLRLRRHPLPDVVTSLRELGSRPAWDPWRLGRAVFVTVGQPPLRARCLVNALIHYRLLHAQGVEAELVIGLRDQPTDKDAHAWIEIDGEDVGPPPGRAGHMELLRY